MDQKEGGRVPGTRGNGNPAGSFLLDRWGTILGFDEGMERLTGWPAVRLVGKDKRATERIGSTAAADQPLYEGDIAIPKTTEIAILRLHTRTGRVLKVDAEVRRIPGSGDRAQVTILRVLARSAPTALEERAAGHDELTGLVGLAGFRTRLAADAAAATESGAPLSMVLADVDHLRDVNDLHGRAAGDTLLRTLSEVLRVVAGDESRLARVGDDDFAVILPGAGRGEARQMAAELRSTVERFPFGEIDRVPVVATLSLGTASFPTDADDAEDLEARAREALDEARALGRNRVWCYLRRPRVPVEVPVYFDASEELLVGYSRDLSPSGIFVQTGAPIDIGMRCAFNFPLPDSESRVHVIGRVVRSVRADVDAEAIRIPGMGVEFEVFGGAGDRHAIDAFVHDRERSSLRPERWPLSY